MMSTPLGRLRLLGYVEGTSMLLLLFVTMPLKYLLHMPGPNLVVGMAHGALFLLYVLALLMIGRERRWPRRKLLLGLLAAVVPFGPFVFDRQLSERPAAAPASDAGEPV